MAAERVAAGGVVAPAEKVEAAVAVEKVAVVAVEKAMVLRVGGPAQLAIHQEVVAVMPLPQNSL